MTYDVTFQGKVFPILEHAFDEALASVYDGRLYLSVAPKVPTYPLGIYQSQDGGGVRFDTIGRNGWDGLVTFRSIDTTKSGAHNRLQLLINALPNVVASGYLIEYRLEHPLWMPVESNTQGNIYTAAIIVRFDVYLD